MTEGETIWERLGSPKFVVAPMVDASELAWRLLSRRHGAQLCYTPMLHSSIFVKNSRYRETNLATCPEDKPLIVQFCGNDPETILKAAKLAEKYCDAVDINLGCPQAIARRGHYGAFLQDEWDLLASIVRTLNSDLNIPVTCKIRVFESIERSVQYAKMLEDAGCKMLTIHGRTREQKGPLTGLASWDHIKAIRDNVSIPVIANGNIQCLVDVERCLAATRCHAVMSAEGNLYNPAIFEGRFPPAWELALEYLDLAEKYPCPISYVRGHLFKLFFSCFALQENTDIRNDMARAHTMEQFRNIVLRLKDKYLRIHNGEVPWNHQYSSYDLQLPPWLCKAYVRAPPEVHISKMQAIISRYSDTSVKHTEAKKSEDGAVKRPKRESSLEPGISKKRMKKLQKRMSANPHCRQFVEKCINCPNPVGLKCEFTMCKTCCRLKCYVENWDCPGHGILIHTRREKAKQFQLQREKGNCEEISPEHENIQVTCR